MYGPLLKHYTNDGPTDHIQLSLQGIQQPLLGTLVRDEKVPAGFYTLRTTVPMKDHHGRTVEQAVDFTFHETQVLLFVKPTSSIDLPRIHTLG